MTEYPSYLHVERTGDGPALVLMHGAGEDACLLAPQAAALAQRGFTAITYDRRGTGRSTRDGWPGGGVRQHVEDAANLPAALERALANAPAVVDVVTSQKSVSSDAKKGLGFVPDYQALTAWDEAERKRREG